MLQLISQDRYDRQSIKQQLDSLVSDQHLVKAISGRRRVLLKPNFVMPAPRHDASTTHPEFYLAVAELLIDRGFHVGIGESPAIGSCRAALKAHDVLEECDHLGVEVVEFKGVQKYDGVESDKRYGQLTIAQELDSWDSLINLPKLKTHQQFTFTAASKNLYGCVTGKRKFLRHNLCANDPVRFGSMILANANRAACALHIGDGITAMHVKGPRNGQPFPLHGIIVAQDHLAHDWLFCLMTGLDPMSTPLFRAASAQEREAARAQAELIAAGDGFQIAGDFEHAPLIHISFSPWAIARSGFRTLRHSFRV